MRKSRHFSPKLENARCNTVSLQCNGGNWSDGKLQISRSSSTGMSTAPGPLTECLKHPIIHPNSLYLIHCPQSLADDFGPAGWSCSSSDGAGFVWWYDDGGVCSVMAWMVWRHQESRPSCHPPPPGPYHPAYPTFSYPRPAEQTLF